VGLPLYAAFFWYSRFGAALAAWKFTFLLYTAATTRVAAAAKGRFTQSPGFSRGEVECTGKKQTPK